MPKVSSEYRDTKRMQIITAAIECFAQKGFAQTTMADIITRSGASAGSIYSNFKNKAEIAREVVAVLFISEVSDGSTDNQRVASPTAFMRQVLEKISERVGDLTILLHVWEYAILDAAMYDKVSSAMQQVMQGLSAYMTRWYIQQGIDSATALVLAKARTPSVIGAFQGYVVQSIFMPDFDESNYLAGIDAIIQKDISE